MTVPMRVPSAFVEDLERVDITVNGPWDLVAERGSYPAAVPVLIDWLGRAQQEVPGPLDRLRFKEGLVRSLAVKEARGVAAPELLREFRREDVTTGYRWAVGNSLSVVADNAVCDELMEIAADRSYGQARQMVVEALGRMSKPCVPDLLVELLEDDDVSGHAVIALGRLRAPRTRAAVERMLEHPRPWVRKEAQKALKRIDA